MDYLKKKVIRGKKRSEDVHYSRTNSLDFKTWRLNIFSETKLNEEEFIAYLKYYIDEWAKAQSLTSLDQDAVDRINH